MFNVLLSGKLVRDPKTGTGQNGKPYTSALLSCPTDSNENILASAIAFQEAAAKLAALRRGDALTLNGRAKLNTWQGKDGPCMGLSVVVSNLLTVYEVGKRRGSKAKPTNTSAPFDDDLGGGEL